MEHFTDKQTRVWLLVTALSFCLPPFNAAKAIKESLKDIQGEMRKDSKKDDKSSSADDGFAMMPTTRKKLLDTLEKGKAALKRLDEIFVARQTANAHQLPGEWS